MKGSPLQIRIHGAAAPSSLPCPALSMPQMTLVWGQFTRISRHPEIATLMFYRNLFTLDPGLQVLLRTGMELQVRKLISALEFALSALPDPAELVPVLEAQGQWHSACGATEADYTVMAAALVETLRGFLGAEFTQEAESAWRAALGFIREALLRGMRNRRLLLNN